MSIIDEIKTLSFTSWWLENKEKNIIEIIFHIDGDPHEIIIKDTKYYVKELYSCEKHRSNILTVLNNLRNINSQKKILFQFDLL